MQRCRAAVGYVAILRDIGIVPVPDLKVLVINTLFVVAVFSIIWVVSEIRRGSTSWIIVHRLGDGPTAVACSVGIDGEASANKAARKRIR